MDDLDAFTGLAIGAAIGSWVWAGVAALIYLS